MNFKILAIVIAGLVIVGIGLYVGFEAKDAEEKNFEDNRTRTIPSFQLKDFSGKKVTNVDFQSRPLVLNSWAAWCPFCREELRDFAAVQKEFKDQVVIIAIDRGEPLETAKQYTDELDVTNDLVFLLDPHDSFYQSIGGFSMPETIFVDRDGNIRIHKRGPMKADEIRKKIQQIL